MKPIGTTLGDTFSGECLIPGAGEAEAKLYIRTSNGSLRWDIGTEITDNGTNEARSTSINLPVGTITAPQLIAGAIPVTAGNKSDHHSQVVQLEPTTGYLNVHMFATTTPTQTCHISIMSFPSA